MNGIKYISYFVISLVLQLLWFLAIKKSPDVTILDMLVLSLLFTLFMFIIDKVFKKKQTA
ncbi:MULTISPECIES: hypothetical protein [Bacillus]|jgi:hypothetical protein|uniref:Uncharacterized protein n=2 Tax=Bacteria TaxID=2 RepID=A0A2A5IAF7_BACPU|nr:MULTISPECIES: hypothetical protein [Bacillus]AOC58889.1 hypothetical protein BEN31_18770 [Bacillus pumilus]AOC58893.1 hypothetical protein BEN31_18795 [Bacillus pumilus]MCY7724290.1 hypothetical protein [Bacillus pumilus]MCY7747520.1 hypothetical protein [Bacillus pumilus]PCK14330.1 hypothetical protein CEY02_21285 [Bacillus pumilus]